MKPRIAHFLLIPELAHSPPNDAAVSAWLDLGFDVDLYAPGGRFDVSRYGPRVRPCVAEYGYRWIVRNLIAARWLDYAAFSGTTEDPMAVAGLLGRVYRRPVVTFADEIKSGSYAGDRSRRWKAWCRAGMRASALTIVNEEERLPLQRAYAGLDPDARMLVYPGCFRQPPTAGDRHALRAARGFPADALLLCYSGVMNHGNGGLWMAEALRACPDLWVWGQIVNLDPLTRGLLERLQGSERLVLERERLSWQDAWASMAAADIGMVVYLQDAPQYRHMGIASNRLCMFLAMGVPVIASRQPSFEFIERYDCGVLADGPEAMAAAVERIGARLPQMRANALTCAREYIRAGERWLELRDALGRVLGAA
jgi:glycosyltransferase involved in cell wall biosynthesis